MYPLLETIPKGLKCTRSLAASLCFVMIIGAAPVYGCPFDRLMEWSSFQSSCDTDCVAIHPLPDSGVVEYLGSPQQFVGYPTVSRSLLHPIQGSQKAMPIPLKHLAVARGTSGVLMGCRYGWVDQGFTVGLRPGSWVSAQVGSFLFADFFLLHVVHDRSFGVYDVNRMRGRQ